MPTSYQQFIATDGHELWRRIDHAQERFTSLVTSVGADHPVSGSTWTARDVLAHVLTVTRRYTDRDVRSTDGLGDSPRAVDAINEAELRALDGTSVEDLLVQLKTQMPQLKAAFPPGSDLDERFPFHGGTSIDLAGALSNLVGEFLIHGRDVAVSAGTRFSIDAGDALLILNGVLQVAPGYAEPSATKSLSVRLRVREAADWMLAFDSGRLDSRRAHAGESADAVLTAPAETLLLVFYSRIGTVASIRRGLLVAGGRRPWRITRLPKLLQQP